MGSALSINFDMDKFSDSEKRFWNVFTMGRQERALWAAALTWAVALRQGASGSAHILNTVGN